MTRLPTLGPRGEGWVALQGVLFVVVAAAGWSVPGSVDGVAAVVLALIGGALVVAGVLVAIRSSVLLGSHEAFTANPRPRAEARLVDQGLYRYVRHPIYAGILLAGLGWAVLRASPVALVADLALFAFFDLKRRREEAWLVDSIPGYREYMTRTPALVPGVY